MGKQRMDGIDSDLDYTELHDARDDAFYAGREQMRKEVIDMIQRMIESFHGLPDEPHLDFRTATSIQARVGRL